MRICVVLAMLVALAGCATTSAPQSETAKAPTVTAPAASVAPLQVPHYREAVQGIKGYQSGQSREPLTTLERAVQQSLKRPEWSKAMAAELSALLGSDATLEAKQFACRQLVLVGSAENVPAIAPLLADEKTAHMARYALQPIPGPEADAALLQALPKAPDAVKVGIINSLGARGTAAAVPELEQQAKSQNAVVAEAATAALARCKK